jgi:hypothetical protein
VKLAVSLLFFSVIALPAAANDILLLKRGYYVRSDASCSEPSNATITLYDGASLGQAHVDCALPVVRKLTSKSYRLRASCHDTQGAGGPTFTYTSVIDVLGETEFALANKYGRFNFRFCAQSDLPAPFHDNVLGTRGSP